MTPCGWEVVPCCPEFDVDSQVDEGVQQRALDLATEIIWAASGRRYGLCEVTVRPRHGGCSSPLAYPYGGGAGWWPVPMPDGTWANMGCGCGASICGCEGSEIMLPGPVAEVTAVRVDGLALTPLVDYTLVDHLRLLRHGAAWPRCNDLTQPDTEPGTWSVAYKAGTPVPAGALAAAGTLACELVRACSGDTACRLPRRVTQVSGQGMDLTLIDPQNFLDKGRTGLPDVDMWLATDNPASLASSPRVFSADLPAPARP